MATIQKVALAGVSSTPSAKPFTTFIDGTSQATGTLGPTIVSHLLADGFNVCTESLLPCSPFLFGPDLSQIQNGLYVNFRLGYHPHSQGLEAYLSTQGGRRPSRLHLQELAYLRYERS